MEDNISKDEKVLSLDDLKSQVFMNIVAWKSFSVELASLKFPQCLEVFSQDEIILINHAERGVNSILESLQKAKEFINAEKIYPPTLDFARELIVELKGKTGEMEQFIHEERNKVFNRFTPSIAQLFFYPLVTLKFLSMKLRYIIMESGSGK